MLKLFISLIAIFVVSGDLYAGSVNLESAKSMFSTISEEHPKTKCFVHNKIASCLELIRGSLSIKEEKEVVSHAYEFSKKEPSVPNLELFIKMIEYSGGQNMKDGAVKMLLAAYRRDAVAKNNVNYLIKAYRISGEDVDIITYISRSSPKRLYGSLFNNSISSDRHRALALEKMYASNDIDELYLGYKISNKNRFLEKILPSLDALDKLTRFSRKNADIKNHPLVIDRKVFFNRKIDSVESRYIAYTLSSDDKDIESILKKLRKPKEIERFISEKKEISTHPLIMDKLADLYRRNNTFEGYISAYQDEKDKKDLVSANKIILERQRNTSVAAADFDVFFNNTIPDVLNFEEMVVILNKITSVDKEKYYIDLIASSGFMDGVTMSNYFQSIEYKVLLHKFKPTIRVNGSDDKVLINVSYPNKTFYFVKSANCVYSHEKSEEKTTGWLVGMFTSVTKRIFHYNIYTCSVRKSDIIRIREFTAKLSNEYSGEYASLRWNKTSFAYSENEYANSNNYGNSGSSQNDYTCSFHCVGQWDSWRGPKHTVTISGSYAGEAEDNVKKANKSICKKYPFYKGGGGSASVGKVTCHY